MRANAGMFIIIIGLLFLTGTAGAAIQVSVAGNSSWLVAGGGSSAVYTVTLTDSISGSPVQGIPVTFAVNPAYGSMSPASVTTNPSGQAVSTFTVNTKSGSAQIFANITAPALSTPIIQNIDHGTLSAKFAPSTGTVGDTVPFVVTIRDPWGNPIDNRRGDDTVSLTVTCPLPNDCSFVGYGHSYSAQPDSNGNVTINTQLGTKIGVNSIILSSIKDPNYVAEKTAFIDAVTSGPASLTAEISPAAKPPYLIPTVSVYTGIFYFRYTISDKFGNPVKNQSVTITTSLAELPSSTTTNDIGQTPVQSYGPKSNVFSGINITATAGNLTNQFTVAFAPSEPTEMVFFAMPQTMESHDVDPSSEASLTARVLDNFGNPVSGQTINFSLAYTPDSNWSVNPSLTTLTGTTDSEGNFKSVFIPGSFNNAAKLDGSATVSATWASKPGYPPKSIKLTWMNYPYLSIFTSVSNQTVLVNDTIDVTIRVVGNGKVNLYGPLTIMLDQDTSSSMKNPSDTVGTREQAASAAATVFIDRLNESTTQMGLETFGKDQNDPSIGHMPCPSAFSDIRTNLALLQGLGPSKDMELSIDTSLNKIIGAAHTGDTKALILLSDGGSNLAVQGTNTTLENKAKANGIYIFTISYLNGNGGETTSNAFNTMDALAKNTGGKHYWNKTSQGLKDIYWDIASQLLKLAAKNTSMSVSFQNISVNNTFMGGSAVYDYIPVGPYYAMNTTVNPDGRTSIIWTNGSQTVKDQSGEWPLLKFDIGTIEIGQNWSTTFRLKVKQLGLIKVFGEGSTISFNGGSGDLVLPDLFINVKTNLTEQGLKTGTLIVTDLQPSSSGPFTDFVPLQWNTHYNSTVSTNKATEYIYYNKGGPWIQFDVTSAPTGDSSQSTSLDVRTLPVGTYNFWVHATAGDANEDNDYLYNLQIGLINRSYIKLQ